MRLGAVLGAGENEQADDARDEEDDDYEKDESQCFANSPFQMWVSAYRVVSCHMFGPPPGSISVHIPKEPWTKYQIQ